MALIVGRHADKKPALGRSGQNGRYQRLVDGGQAASGPAWQISFQGREKLNSAVEYWPSYLGGRHGSSQAK